MKCCGRSRLRPFAENRAHDPACVSTCRYHNPAIVPKLSIEVPLKVRLMVSLRAPLRALRVQVNRKIPVKLDR